MGYHAAADADKAERYHRRVFEFNATEGIGYLASLLIVISLAMTSVVRLRTISLLGSITFVVYGALIGAVPILLANLIIAGLNVWFLRAELGGRRDLGASVIPPDAPFLTFFVRYHLDDLQRYQPDFRAPDDGEPLPWTFALLLTRDGLPAGLVLGRRDADDPTQLEVLLDHVLAAYRDSRIGTWLYGPGAKVFRDHGIDRLVTSPGDATHTSYLDSVGFERRGDRYVLEL